MRRVFIVIAAGLVVLSAGAVLGGAFVHLRPWPYPLMANAYRRLNPPPKEPRAAVHSKFFDLLLEEFQPPLLSSGHGGGLSEYAEDAILLTGEGRLYLLDIEQLQMKPLAIAVPPNGRETLYSKEIDGKEPTFIKYKWHRYTDIAYHNGVLYVAYSHFNEEDECFTSRLARLTVAKPIEEVRAVPSDWEMVFETTPCFGFQTAELPYAGHQAGGRMAVSPDGKLYLTIGDYHFDGNPGASFPQDPSASYGKVFRLDLSSQALEMFTLGHRNNQGIAVTPTGEVWSTEHGPEGGDELNFLIEGGNYGWPYETYGTDYGARIWPLAERQGRHDRFRKPSWAWVPSIGVSNLDYVDAFHPIWQGNLLVASLNDGAIYRVVTDGPHVVTFERIEVGERLRDVLVHSGYIIAYTDRGYVFRISPVEEPMSQHLDELSASLSRPALAELSRCLECHGRSQTKTAPNLCGLLGRAVGRSAFEGYSDALATRGGTWDEALFLRFLADAESVVPGIQMPDPGIADATLRGEISSNLDFFCETIVPTDGEAGQAD